MMDGTPYDYQMSWRYRCEVGKYTIITLCERHETCEHVKDKKGSNPNGHTGTEKNFTVILSLQEFTSIDRKPY